MFLKITANGYGYCYCNSPGHRLPGVPDTPPQGWGQQFFCRRCAVVEELCHPVKELQEEVNRLHVVSAKEQETDRLFLETLRSQDSWES